MKDSNYSEYSYNYGLVLEGGGQRGVYSAGVLDYLMDKELFAPYVIGVSAGACQAYSYISRQKGRSFHVASAYSKDKRYLSYRNLLKTGSVFGMDFMFDEIPNKYVPFDYETFNNSEQRFVIATTDCFTGEPVYFTKDDEIDMFLAGRASSSLPLLSIPVKINNSYYFDGGVADPVPVKKAFDDGCRKVIAVLTRNEGYRKKPSKRAAWIIKRRYPKFTGLAEVFKKRYEIYNDTLDWIAEKEKAGDIFVIRPTKKVLIERTETDEQKLQDFYIEGIKDAKQAIKRLEDWLKH